MHPPTSLRTLIDAQAQRLQAAQVAFGHGTTNALDEAAWLVLWQLGLPLHSDIDDASLPQPTAQQVSAAHALVTQRIATRQPAAYLTREAWLQGVPFYVDARVIIPRSLIAEPLAEGVVDDLLGQPPARVLDLCTGNGSLAVLAALAWPQAQVVAADISAQALEVAAINVARHGVQERVALLASDGLQAVPATPGFDLLLCNPPYVNQASMEQLPAEFRCEPALALAGGADGMDFVRQLLAQAKPYLRPQGALVLEIGHEAAHFVAAFPHLPVLWLPTSAGAQQVLWLNASDLP